MGTDARSILIRRTSQVNQIVVAKTLKWLIYQELHERMKHLGDDRVYQLAIGRVYWEGMQEDARELH